MNQINNLFAITDCHVDPIRRISLNAALQADVASLFEEQRESFLRNKQPVIFSASYKVDLDELFIIKGFTLSEAISGAIQNPLTCPTLDLNGDLSLKAIFSGKWDSTTKMVYFQSCDARKLLKKGFTLINAKNTYTKLVDPGITLSNKLTAIYDNGQLLFDSYHNTKRYLDLSNYFREATDEELDKFLSTSLFKCEDVELFKSSADSIIRKKIALLLSNNVLDDVTISELNNAARELNSAVAEEYRINLEIEDEKLVIPKEKRVLKELIRFLDEDYVTTPITKRKCLTNSKTYL